MTVIEVCGRLVCNARYDSESEWWDWNGNPQVGLSLDSRALTQVRAFSLCCGWGAANGTLFVFKHARVAAFMATGIDELSFLPLVEGSVAARAVLAAGVHRFVVAQ